MKAASTLFAAIIVTVTYANAAETTAANQQERIARLEARVAQLERMVDALSAGLPARERAADTEQKATEAAAPDAMAAALSQAASDLPLRKTSPQTETQELLPQLGKIGATAFLDAGLNTGPFSLGRGSYFGGGLSLPLALLPGGRLNYEVSAGLAQNSRTLPITSNVAQLANLTILNALFPAGGTNNIVQAFTGTGAAPFVVTQPADWRAQTLEVIPLALRYDLTRWDRRHVRPYAAVGLGTYVTITNQVATGAVRQNANLNPATLLLIQQLLSSGSPLAGALLGGQLAPASQLQARGIPAGQGGLDLGLQSGGGIEFRMPAGLSFAVDARYNYAPSGTSFAQSFTRLGWHF